jgi:predicted transcriptional regulator
MPELLELTAEIVANYVGNNTVATGDLHGLIKATYDALAGIGKEPVQQVDEQPKATPAQIRKSITDDAIICLEDGRKFKSLKRHLRTKFDMSPEEYRAKWGLPKDYPMVAPAYAQARSSLAKSMGLGQGGRKAKAPVKAAKAPRKARSKGAIDPPSDSFT